MKMAELIDKREVADYIWNNILTTGIEDKDDAGASLWKFIKAYERLIIYLLKQQEEQKKEEPA